MEKIVIANFKNYLTDFGTYAISRELSQLKNASSKLWICPNTQFFNCCGDLTKKTGVKVGLQNLPKVYGNVQIEVEDLCEKGISFAIVGHPSVRFVESLADIREKLEIFTSEKFMCVCCLVSSGAGFKDKLTHEMLQIISSKINLDYVMFAYEPEGAVGTGMALDMGEIEKRICFIKEFIKERFKKDVKVLYGGSVDQINARAILSIKCVDGLLVGKNSFDIDTMAHILNWA